MGERRYKVEDEKVGKWLIEEMVESAGLETDDVVRVTITDYQTDRRESGVGANYEEARAVACDKLGISERELEDEIDEE